VLASVSNVPSCCSGKIRITAIIVRAKRIALKILTEMEIGQSNYLENLHQQLEGSQG